MKIEVEVTAEQIVEFSKLNGSLVSLQDAEEALKAIGETSQSKDLQRVLRWELLRQGLDIARVVQTRAKAK